MLAENYLIKLAEFLRFSISHNEQNIIPVGEELTISLYYLEVQKIRFLSLSSSSLRVDKKTVNRQSGAFTVTMKTIKPFLKRTIISARAKPHHLKNHSID